MSVKDFLSQLKAQKNRTLYLEQDVAYLNGAMVSLGGPTFGVKSSGGIKDRAGFVAFVECKDQKERQLIAERERLAALIAQAERVIETVPDMKVRRVLKLYYLEDKSVTEQERRQEARRHVGRKQIFGIKPLILFNFTYTFFGKRYCRVSGKLF